MKLEHIIRIGLEGKLALNKYTLCIREHKYDLLWHLGVVTLVTPIEIKS